CLADARFLDRSNQIDAGIVDQDVDPAGAATHLINAGFGRSLIADIERHELDACKRSGRRGGADAPKDLMAAGDQEFGGGPANAGRCACDQDYAPWSVRHESSARSPQSRSARDDQDHLLLARSSARRRGRRTWRYAGSIYFKTMLG